MTSVVMTSSKWTSVVMMSMNDDGGVNDAMNDKNLLEPVMIRSVMMMTSGMMIRSVMP